MTIDRTQLPHGVTLPSRLAEPDARAIISTLARHYRMTYVLFGRSDIEKRLPGNAKLSPESPQWRRLTDDEWSRVLTTAAWTALTRTAERWLDAAGAMDSAIRQAALHCRSCGRDLGGPPQVTWGLCPACLNNTDLNDLRDQACPVSADDRPHQWHNGTCLHCDLPATTPPSSSPAATPIVSLPNTRAA